MVKKLVSGFSGSMKAWWSASGPHAEPKIHCGREQRGIGTDQREVMVMVGRGWQRVCEFVNDTVEAVDIYRAQ
jgi:hypothetical protein